jgi:DNA-binding CsgD family transcriptional regulator
MPSHPFLLPLHADLVSRARNGLLTLLPGEARVLAEFLQGATRPEIAALLKITTKTVETHMSRVLMKCGCSSTQLLRICCHDISDDREVFERLGELAAKYPYHPGRPPIKGATRDLPAKGLLS